MTIKIEERIFRTRDIDFAAALVSQPELFMREHTPTGYVASRVDAPRVEIVRLVPYRDRNARVDSKSVRYEFHLRGLDEESEEDFRSRMREVAQRLLNKQLLVEPMMMLAWKRQFRSWMLETDEERQALIDEQGKAPRMKKGNKRR